MTKYLSIRKYYEIWPIYALKSVSVEPYTKGKLANFQMRPKKTAQGTYQKELFRPELIKMIDPSQGLVKLAKVVNWERMDAVFGETYCPDNDRPGVGARLMVSLHYLKYTHN